MSEQKRLLSPIFEPELSLDNKKPGSSRSIHLFERMAERLDEIAANTRGLVRGMVAHASFIHKGNRSNTEKGQKKAQQPIPATIKAKLPARINKDTVRPAAVQKPVLASINSSQAKEHALLTSKEQFTDSPGVSSGVRAAKKRASDKKTASGAAVPVSQSKSAIANNEAKEKRNAEENGNRIAEAVLSGMDKFRNLLKSGADAVSQNNDLKDAAGYALGGPFYGALKEIKEALPNIASEKPDDDKERKADSRKLLKAINNSDGRQQDDKGRFIKPDQNAARRQIAQTEVAEAQLALEEKEAKKEEKRHKELIRAVKANKRGMMDRFLDRRMGLGRRGRDRIIRERTVHDKAKAGAKTVRAKGPKPDARLLANTASNGRLSREADIGRRSGRKGILSRAGGVAQAAGKAVTGTLAMGGKALGGMLRMLPGIGQALALGMAVYDGFQGWNDKELHQQAFGLKDGQEATTGQKASSAAASILDMGGLTSSLLGMFGIEFDKAGVARSIYELGSNIGQLASDVIGVGLPLLKSAWKGIEDFGSKIWQGAKDVGGSIAQFATGVWEKGTAFAADIGTWAKGAINDGVGIVTGIWNDAKSAVSGCWAKLSGFAEDSISKGGKILSDLWNSAKELPGKIIDGAADLAKGALETGGKLLSNGWNAVKNWGKGLFSSDEAKAEPVNQAELKPAPVAHQESAQKETAPIAHEAVAITDPVVKPETGNKASSIVDPAIDSKLSSINTEENAQKSATSSEAASSALALEQMKQNDIENKSREEIIDNLEQANKYINNISKLLGEEFRKDELPDEFGIAGALQNVSSAIESARYSGGGNTFYSGGGNAAYSGASGGSAASGVYAGFGDIVSMGETSGKGTAMVSTGKGDHGGVSYGRNQLASKAGSIPAAMKWARANGFEDIANQLEPLQGDATNYNGQFAQKWRQLAAEKGGRLEQFDRAYQKQGYYDPMMAKIRQSNPELAKRIEANPALQEQVLSTATQYGMNSSRYLSAANEALGKNANLSDRELLVAIQDIKARDVGINFAKSSKDVQRSIVNRHGKEEKQRLLALHDKFERGEIKIDPQTGTASVAGQNLHYDGSSQGVRLKDDGKTVDLSTVQGVESLRLQQGVNIDKMHPEAVSRLGRMAQDYEKITGQKLEISEGYRDYAEQVRVKKKYGADAATPGKSTHGMGNTFDIAKSKIVDVENRLKQAGINPVQFFKDHGFERSAYRPGASRKHDESWHLEATDLRTAEMQADREHRQSGKKTGAEYMTAEQRAKYMAPKIAPASPQALADNQANTAPETIQPTNDSQPVSNNSPVQVAEAQTSAENKLSESSSPVPQVAMTLEPASQGVSLAQANNAAPVGVPIRNPIDVPAIREIDPGREVKTSSNDNGPILKVLGEILAAIQAGNKKMANSGNNDGSPFISTEYDDPAAQGLAADSA